MSHDEQCGETLAFPRVIANRPGLARLDYRIGTYAELREALLRWRDQTPELSGWTHRGADDPGVALLECAAIAGDILTFYQELYANECFLRTATWRDSVAELVRLTGYRLAPAIGGHGVFHARVLGDEAVTIPAGFPLTAQLADVPATVTLETTAELIAHAWMNELTLVAPVTSPRVETGVTSLVIDGDPGLRRGDRIELGIDSGSGRDFTLGSIAIVESTATRVGETVVRLRAPLQLALAAATMTVHKLGRSWRHFGHNAPPVWATVGSDGLPQRETTVYDRGGDELDLPLDTRVPDLVPGATVLWVAQTDHVRLMARRTVEKVVSQACTFGPLTAGVTVAHVDAGLAHLGIVPDYDLRKVEIHEVAGGPWTARAAPPAPTGDGDALLFYGDGRRAAQLAGRRWLLSAGDAEPHEVRLSPQDVADPDETRLRAVTISEPVPLAQFDRDAPLARLLGNVVEASEGATQVEVKLGNGDARRSWQTLRVPKAPLTYLRSAAADSGHAPELTLIVGGVIWRRVESLHAAGPEDEVYVVRQDERGDSFVQAGDGVTGRRFPSGIGNIVARYRIGAGAHGPRRAGTAVRGGRRLPGFDRMLLAGVIGGGGPAESAETARRAAPARLQSLGRLVSLADYEAETLAQPGVEECAARWDQVDGVPSIVLTVLMEHGRAAELGALRETILAAERCRGARRHPIDVRAGHAEYLYLSVAYALADGARHEDVEAAIGAALTADDGLFGRHHRRLGQPEYANRVLGVVQQVAGVRWATVAALGSFGTTPADEPRGVPSSPARLTTVPCPPDHVLRLETLHLQRVDGIAVECAR